MTQKGRENKSSLDVLVFSRRYFFLLSFSRFSILMWNSVYKELDQQCVAFVQERRKREKREREEKKEKKRNIRRWWWRTDRCCCRRGRRRRRRRRRRRHPHFSMTIVTSRRKKERLHVLQVMSSTVPNVDVVFNVLSLSCSQSVSFASFLLFHRSSTIMGKGGKNWDPPSSVNDQTDDSSVQHDTVKTQQYTWEEIRRHSTKKDRWLVINKRVYDVTRWHKHPGGQVVLNHYAGQDATVCIR
jgi:hypothetical protein